MNSTERALRAQLLRLARQLGTAALGQGKSGNASVRHDAGFLVTPTGLAYDAMSIEDLVWIDADNAAHGTRSPSSEWRMHRGIYASQPYTGAVVHTHSPYATTLACLRRGIPAFHYEVAFAGGKDIRCSDYATFGTQDLSDHALAALDGRRACLLANHGTIACGADPDEALALAEKVESLARLYWQALQVGEPVILADAEMARVLERFATYGK
jgi:L-fuculose-phosphate aldolase